MRGQIWTNTSNYIARSYSGILLLLHVIAMMIIPIVSNYMIIYNHWNSLSLVSHVISIFLNLCHFTPKAGEIDVNRLVRNSGTPWHGVSAAPAFEHPVSDPGVLDGGATRFGTDSSGSVHGGLACAAVSIFPGCDPSLRWTRELMLDRFGRGSAW